MTVNCKGPNTINAANVGSRINVGKMKPDKNQGFNGIRTRDLRDTGAMLYQQSYEATNWERGKFIEF